ncbi:MAG: hypothetical protein RL226_970 [Bacteroidota bacterium]
MINKVATSVLFKAIILLIFSAIGYYSYGQSTVEVVSSHGYTVHVTVNPVETEAPSFCPWGYLYRTKMEYSVSFSGSNIPTSLWMLQGYIVCNGQSNYVNLPETASTGTTWSSYNYRFATDCDDATPETLNCGNFNLAISGPGISARTIAMPISFEEEEDEEDDDEEDDEEDDEDDPIITYTWNGIVNNDWENPLNWLLGEIPSEGDDVVLSTTGSNPEINGTIRVNDITIGAGCAIQFNNSSSNLRVTGDFINNGTFSPGEGKVTFEGNSDQSIQGTSVPRFHGLRINTSGTVSLETDIELSGLLQPDAGTIDWNDHTVTLVSGTDVQGAIGTIADNAEIIGDSIIYHRFFPAASGNWRMLATPLTDATFEQWNDDIPTTGFPGADYPNYPSAANPWPNIRKYSDANVDNDMAAGFYAIGGITETIENGAGYFTYFIPSGTTLDMEGTFKRGEHTWELTNNNPQGNGNKGWHLIGNPYPCAIDWDNQAGWSRQGITGAVYAFDPSQGQYSSYNNGVSAGQLKGKIGSFQAFWVKAVGNNATLTINEQAKYTSNGVMLRSADANTESLIRIKLTTSDAAIWDDAVLGFNYLASNEFDSDYDAVKMFATNTDLPNIALLPDTTLDPMSICLMPVPDESFEVGLMIKPGNKTSFTITNIMVDSFEDNICLVLEDKETETTHPFNLGDSYSFSKGEMDLATRFTLRVNAPLDVTVVNESCPGEDNASIIAQGFGDAPWTYTWIDEMGNVIRTSENLTTADHMENVAPGFYEIQVTNNNEFCSAASKIVQVEAAVEGQVTAMGVAATCNKMNNGIIHLIADRNYVWDVSIVNGDNGYTRNVNDLHGDTLLFELPAGIYQVTANNGCENLAAELLVNLRDPLGVRSEAGAFSNMVNLNQGGVATFINNSSPNAYQFKWEFGDGSADSTNFQPTHTYTHWGQYNVKLIASNEVCSDTSFVAIQVSGVGGGTEGDLANMEPIAALGEETTDTKRTIEVNVAGDQLSLSPGEEIAEEVTVKINTITGQLVMEKTFGSLPSGKTNVDITSLRQGLYTYGIQTKSELLKSGEFTK